MNNTFTKAWHMMRQKVREINSRRVAIMASLAAGIVVFAPGVFAIAAPAAGSFAYDVYDVVVVQVLGGPIGFVGGLATIVYGASQLMRSWMIAVLAIVSGTVIIKADTITASLGMLISGM